jgi:hypothetical protein
LVLGAGFAAVIILAIFVALLTQGRKR